MFSSPMAALLLTKIFLLLRKTNIFHFAVRLFSYTLLGKKNLDVKISDG